MCNKIKQNKCSHLFYCSIYFILVHMKPHHKTAQRITIIKVNKYMLANTH